MTQTISLTFMLYVYTTLLLRNTYFQCLYIDITYLIKHHMIYAFSISAALCFGHFIPSTHCVGGEVGPRASLDVVVKRKIFV